MDTVPVAVRSPALQVKSRETIVHFPDRFRLLKMKRDILDHTADRAMVVVVRVMAMALEKVDSSAVAAA